MKRLDIKKHLSVFGLFCRSTVYRLLAVSVAAMGAEVFLFVRAAVQNPDYGIEKCIESSHIMWVLCAWYLLFLAVLCIPGSDFGSKSIYTMRRLRISEKWVFVWQSTYNLLAFLLLWTLQIITAYGLCRLYGVLSHEGFFNQQTVFLAFYRSELLHSILPLEEGTRWAINIIILLSSASSCAYFGFRNRRGSFAVSIALEAVVVIASFVREVGYFGLLPISLIFVIGADLFNVFAWEEEEDYAEPQQEKDPNGAVV